MRAEHSRGQQCGCLARLLAMVGFAVSITVKISTGKGLLQNFGLTSPLPMVALAVTGLVEVLAAVFIFQSTSKK